MCCLWTCKRRERILYYAAEYYSELDEKDAAEEGTRGEVHCNPDAISETATGDQHPDDDIDSGISGGHGSDENQRRNIAGAAAAIAGCEISPSAIAASAEVVMELKAAVGSVSVAGNGGASHSVQETVLTADEAGSRVTETGDESAAFASGGFEEIPSLDSLSIDWPPAGVALPFCEWPGMSPQPTAAPPTPPTAAEEHWSLNLSEISDIA